MLSIVVLPHPDGPSIETNSLRLKARSMPLRAWTTSAPVLYSFEIFRSSSILVKYPFLSAAAISIYADHSNIEWSRHSRNNDRYRLRIHRMIRAVKYDLCRLRKQWAICVIIYQSGRQMREDLEILEISNHKLTRRGNDCLRKTGGASS